MQIEPTTKIWLKFDKVKFILPVNPSELEITEAAPQDAYNILGSGQVQITQLPDLRVVKFKSFFPGNTEPFTQNEILSPNDYINHLENALNSATKGRIIVNRPSGWNLSMPCTIKSFKTTDKGGEPGDIYYQIELTEWRKYKPEKIVIKNVKGENKAVIASVQRDTSKVLRVGAKVVANGVYCYDSYGSKPHGTANNLNTEVKRIVSGRAYPILIGSYGWTKESSLQIKG